MFRKNNILAGEELSSFCRQINMIIKAGLPTYYGISILHDETTDPALKALFGTIYESMEQGATLCESLTPTGIFPKYMLQMIHIGEQTGRLEEVLDSLSTYYEREAEIQDSVRHAVTYPLLMSVMMFAVLIVMITKIVPIFADVYANLGSSLSGSARLLMDISRFLNQYLLWLIIGLAILGLLIFLFLQTVSGKRLICRLPIMCSLATSRFANCMYLSLASGLDSEHSLTLAESLVGNEHIVTRIHHCKEYIRSGETLARALLLSGLFSNLYASFITIGYKTTAMDDVMLHISKAYEDETDERLRRFVSILEPALIVILSIFIGLILLSFLLPLLGILSSIG